MAQREIVNIFKLINLFQHHLPLIYKNILNLPFSIIVKSPLDSHNRPSLTFSTPKCYKIHQGVVLRLQYEYYAIFWKTFPLALDVHAQRVLKYNYILINDFTIIENGRFKMFL
jgi:hypothetical protein